MHKLVIKIERWYAMMFIDREILDGIEINYPTDEEIEQMYREYLIEKEYSENG